MSILEDNGSGYVEISAVHDIIERLGLDGWSRGYLTGRVDAFRREGLNGRRLEQLLDDLRDRTDDGISTQQADRFRTELESLFA